MSMSITLKELKEALKIDFRDDDQFLTTLLNAAKERAASITGLTEEDFNEDIKSGIIQDVATRYANRDDLGGATEGINASLYIYRRNATRPIF